MKLLDILTEAGGLDAIIGTTSRLNAQSGNPQQIQELKTQLSRHTLVTNLDANGELVLGNRAWVGPVDSEWTLALSDAITAWKRSVNFQLEKAGRSDTLNTAGPGVISGNDLKYLSQTALTPQGLLRVASAPRRATPQAPPFEGQKYSRQLGQESSAGINTIRDMVNAIGWSGWYRLSWALSDIKGASEDKSSRNEAAKRFILDVYSYMNETSPLPWIDNFNKSTYTLGNQDRVINGVNLKIDVRLTPTQIYEKLAPVLLKLWEGDAQEEAERNEVTAAAGRGEAVVAGDDITQIARNLHTAMFGGTGIGTDEQAINEELKKLRSSGDWNNLVSKYSEMFEGRTLHVDLYDELKQSPEDYANYVTANLVRLNVINHLLLHSMINFGSAESVAVSLDSTSYQVNRERENNKVVIDGYDEFDDIVIDQILKAALESQGTAVPENLTVETTTDDKQTAGGAFIAAVEEQYPEMVTWYTYQEPFKTPDNKYPDIGGMRLKGIVDQAAQLVAVGTSTVALNSFILEEIRKDREWLVGTGENNPGVANIKFDDKYGSEGGATGRYFPETSDDDLVELDADEQELVDALISEQDPLIRQAISVILDNGNSESFYIKLYQGAAPQHYLDKQLGKDDTVKEYVLNRADDDSHLMRLINVLGVPVSAPRTMAELFKEASEWSLWEGPTDDKLLTALIDLIRNKSDYNLVDARYRALPKASGQSLLEDMGNEQWIQRWGDTYYNRLARKIGDSDIALVSAETSSRLRSAMDDISETLDESTVDALETAIGREGTIPFKKVNPILDALDEIVEIHSSSQDPALEQLVGIRNAFLHYRRHLQPRGWRPGVNSPMGSPMTGGKILELAAPTYPSGMRVRGGQEPTEIDSVATTASGEDPVAAN